MRKIKDVLRLKWAMGMSNRQIASSTGIGCPTVAECLRRAQEAGVRWPLSPALEDARLELLLFPPPPDLPAQVRGIPDWLVIHQAAGGGGHPLRQMRQHLDRGAKRRSPQGRNRPKPVPGQ